MKIPGLAVVDPEEDGYLEYSFTRLLLAGLLGGAVFAGVVTTAVFFRHDIFRFMRSLWNAFPF